MQLIAKVHKMMAMGRQWRKQRAVLATRRVPGTSKSGGLRVSQPRVQVRGLCIKNALWMQLARAYLS